MPDAAAMTIDEVCDGLGIPADVRRFEASPCGEVVFGPGAATRVGELVKAQSSSGRVLVVTDGGIVRAGHCGRVLAALETAGLRAGVFDRVRENPTTEDVDRCVEAARQADADTLIGLGGGSSMDTAKGANFLLTNGGRIPDYRGVGKASKPMLPFLALPTTAGTGSECQSFALIADPDTHQKMACGDRKAAAAVTILDPELTVTQPLEVATHTGIDALSHALESLVTNCRNEVSMAYSTAAFKLIDSGFEAVVSVAKVSMLARARMQVGAAFAGAAIENSMLGAAHAAANPLTARFDVVHGQAVGCMLPHVIRFNSMDPVAAAIYSTLAADPKHLAARVESLLETAGMRIPLTRFGVREEDLPALAEEAAGQWTAGFNPRPVDGDAFHGLYRQAMVYGRNPTK